MIDFLYTMLLMRSMKAVPKPEPVPPEKERFMMIPSRVLHFYNCFVNFYIDSSIRFLPSV